MQIRLKLYNLIKTNINVEFKHNFIVNKEFNEVSLLRFQVSRGGGVALLKPLNIFSYKVFLPISPLLADFTPSFTHIPFFSILYNISSSFLNSRKFFGGGEGQNLLCPDPLSALSPVYQVLRD